MLLVAARAREAMVEHAEAGAPEEVCGVMAGRRDGGDRRVEAVHRVPNVAARPRTEYRLDPEAQLARIDEVEAAGRTVVGFYHSHPAGPAGPSPTDEARATWPGHAYAIVSLAGTDAELGAWEWTGAAFERLELRVVD